MPPLYALQMPRPDRRTNVLLHARREHLKELAEAEAQGETFWTSDFDPAARTRLREVLRYGWGKMSVMGSPAADVSRLLRLQIGLDVHWENFGGIDRFMAEGPDRLIPSVIEAAVFVMSRRGVGGLEEPINCILAEHRTSFEFINDEMVGFESKELHQEVVAPTLRLLSGRPGWDKVELAYQHALREISEGHSADAITDAGTALQEALTVLGCEGNALGPLIKSARKQGILGPHDATLTEGVEKVLHWVSADRSELGDNHKAGTVATRDDAWFIVHVVGAAILRLAGGSPRQA